MAPGWSPIDAGVQLAQEGDRLEVLAAAVDVGHPLAGLAACSRGRASRRRHRRAAPSTWKRSSQNSALASRKFAHLAAAVIVDQRVPVAVEALARIVRARRARCRRSGASPCASVGKCAGTQSMITPMPASWQRSTKRRELVRRAEAAGRREQPDRLIAPRAVERMLADRQQLEVGEAQVLARRAPARRPSSRRSRNALPCARAATSRGAPRRSRSARASALRAARRPIHAASSQANGRRTPRARRCAGGAPPKAERVGLERQELAFRPERDGKMWRWSFFCSWLVAVLLGGGAEAGDHRGEGGLAGAVLPDERDRLPGLDGQA